MFVMHLTAMGMPFRLSLLPTTAPANLRPKVHSHPFNPFYPPSHVFIQTAGQP